MIKELVHEDAFREHLGNVLSSERVLRDCISRCRRVELHEGNLLNHYNLDGGRSLLNRLEYSASDEKSDAKQRHSIPIDGKIRTGTASLRNAVQHYLDFLKQKG
ncbi:hypothetical protein ACFVVQ_07665 [Paenibacillus chitinolyticus]|uniref:hypothetical protein n=1 Tax=Paenibacillus chitinolyticus TaxID=79263 RepID=UPI0036D9A0AD